MVLDNSWLSLNILTLALLGEYIESLVLDPLILLIKGFLVIYML